MRSLQSGFRNGLGIELGLGWVRELVKIWQSLILCDEFPS